MEKTVKISFFRIIWTLSALALFISGVIQHDWLYLVAGLLLDLHDIEIVHWQGKKYESY